MNGPKLVFKFIYDFESPMTSELQVEASGTAVSIPIPTDISLEILMRFINKTLSTSGQIKTPEAAEPKAETSQTLPQEAASSNAPVQDNTLGRLLGEAHEKQVKVFEPQDY